MNRYIIIVVSMFLFSCEQKNNTAPNKTTDPGNSKVSTKSFLIVSSKDSIENDILTVTDVDAVKGRTITLSHDEYSKLMKTPTKDLSVKEISYLQTINGNYIKRLGIDEVFNTINAEMKRLKDSGCSPDVVFFEEYEILSKYAKPDADQLEKRLHSGIKPEEHPVGEP